MSNVRSLATTESDLPFTCAARNALWIYPAPTPPRFKGAPTIIDTKRTYEQPDFDQLPEQADVTVELYGRAQSFRLDGMTRRIYIERFEFVSFKTDAEARAAFADLWEQIRYLNSLAEIQKASRDWYESRQRAQC
jgi:hypothetical protein